MNWAVPAVAQMASLMPDSVFGHAVSGQNETGAVFPDWMMHGQCKTVSGRRSKSRLQIMQLGRMTRMRRKADDKKTNPGQTDETLAGFLYHDLVHDVYDVRCGTGIIFS